MKRKHHKSSVGVREFERVVLLTCPVRSCLATIEARRPRRWPFPSTTMGVEESWDIYRYRRTSGEYIVEYLASTITHGVCSMAYGVYCRRNTKSRKRGREVFSERRGNLTLSSNSHRSTEQRIAYTASTGSNYRYDRTSDERLSLTRSPRHPRQLYSHLVISIYRATITYTSTTTLSHSVV